MSTGELENLQEETTMAETTPAQMVEIMLFGTTHGAEPNAVRPVTRAKADQLIANGLAVEVQHEDRGDVEGVLVQSDTAGTGPAVNAETGQVTQPGEPLPTMEQEGGEPLELAGEDDA